MKKFAYLSMMILSLVLVSTSCCKDDDEITPDNPNTAYLGNWYNTETRVNNVVNTTVTQKEFEFQTVKLIITANNNASYNVTYPTWSISGTTLTITDEYGQKEIYTIVSVPPNLILSIGTYTYKLHK
jgi:hypothetical protein